MVGLTGLEPVTSRLSSERSNQLSYTSIFSVEQVKGIEPSCRPWQGRVLPLNYTCVAVQTGLEPAISSVTGRHVNHYTTGPFTNFMAGKEGFEPSRQFDPTYTLSRGTSSAT